jgi:hypothetical protein
LLIRFDGWKMWCWFIFIHFCTNYIIWYYDKDLITWECHNIWCLF